MIRVSADRCGDRQWSTAASRRRWKRTAFGEDLHVLERRGELCGPPRPVHLAGRGVCQHRVVEEQRVDDLRGGRRHGPRLERAVIEVVRPALPHGLCVGIGELRFSYENLIRDRPYRAKFTVFPRRDRARDPQPFTDVAVLADPLPDFSGGPADSDFQRNGSVSRGGYHDAAGGRPRWLSGWRRSL